MASPNQAIEVIRQIGMAHDFFEHPNIKKCIEDSIPFTGIVRERGALGFNTPLWVGLGIVGIWAALDAFAERGAQRCASCDRSSCIQERFRFRALGNEEIILGELDDFRHLYAHNCAGRTDATYFTKKRHVLAEGATAQLTCGAQFNGEQLHLQIPQLKYYASAAQSLLERFA